MDLNCDLAEGFPNDQQLIPLITSANLACAFHAGAPDLMVATALLCQQHGVHVGAHPGFQDAANFGRLEQPVTGTQVYALVAFQVSGLLGLLRSAGIPIHHVKLHGALYNQTARDLNLAKAAVQAVRDLDPELIFYGLAGSAHVQAALEMGIRVWQEAFLDRSYLADGSLTPRSHPGAVHQTEQAALGQAQEILQGHVTALTGEQVPLAADTLCLHGDGDHAVLFAQQVRAALQAAGQLAANCP